jgi:hypothetical protein
VEGMYMDSLLADSDLWAALGRETREDEAFRRELERRRD